MIYIEKLPYWFRALIVVVITGVSLQFIMASNKQPEYNPMIKFYNLSGQVQTPRKILIDRVAITSATGQMINISSAGFSHITAAFPIGENNTTSIPGMPIVSVQVYSNTQLSINTTVGNTAVLAILQGLKSPTDFTGMFVDIVIIGD